jgi:membrane-bound lytic murein transglycosylase D
MKLKNIFVSTLFAITLLIPFFSRAESLVQVPDTSNTISKNDPIASMLDSLLNLRVFEYLKKEKSKKQVNKFGFAKDSVPIYNDLVYEARLAKLDARSPFQLDYNESVQGYINMYAYRKKNQVSKMLALSDLYFPLFEEKLNKHGLPLELKYLAIVESALNANAKSRVGAMGLWQFMYGTGKMFDLRVNSYVDERCDPVKATEAACLYLKFLYGMYKDWQLALAAYNAGPGTVNKAIRRSGGKTNYWELRPYLPLETRGYVPAFIAVNYVMNYTEEHNIYASGSLMHILETDTVWLKQPLTFSQISAALNIPVEDIQFLNPVYRHNIIPCLDGEFNSLCLPKDLITRFLMEEEVIYASLNAKNVENPRITFVSDDNNPVKKQYVVKKGETISLIATKHKCTVAEIKSWNRLKSNSLMAGQKLTIYSNGAAPQVATKTVQPNQPTAVISQTKTTDAGSKVIYYTVQPGDTLYKIASKYDGVTVEDLQRLNNIQNPSSIKVGSKLKVMVNG